MLSLSYALYPVCLSWKPTEFLLLVVAAHSTGQRCLGRASQAASAMVQSGLGPGKSLLTQQESGTQFLHGGCQDFLCADTTFPESPRQLPFLRGLAERKPGMAVAEEAFLGQV